MASRGLNKVMIIGNLGSDPEVRYMPSGGAVATLSIATSEVWKDKDTGQSQERTEWHRAVLFNRLGEISGEYLKKGAKVYIEGSLRTRKWQDKNSVDRYTTEIVASNMQMLDSRQAVGDLRQAGSMTQDYSPHAGSAFESNPVANAESTNTVESNFSDDDVPF